MLFCKANSDTANEALRCEENMSAAPTPPGTGKAGGQDGGERTELVIIL